MKSKKARKSGENNSGTRTTRQTNLKIQKGIIAGAVIVILMALLVIPKYESYCAKRLILAEKERYNMELPDEMSEEQYLKELEVISQQLDDNRNSLPERLDTVSLYENIGRMAEVAKVGVLSVEFGAADVQIDESLGMQINQDFQNSDEKTIIGPDGKILTRCEYVVVCTGNDNTFIEFLNELNRCVPVTRVISYEIETGAMGEKRLRMRLESFGILADNRDNQVTVMGDQLDEAF
ncbi:hypothetical protein FXB42_08075 [Acetobacterium wieringae]|uniref:Pilus assembly protein, PilO n=1 Tax=Acetobacterium wieringae TaxID=52694 RepID=A0A5D0WPX4_9FIRM|nr:hypothetical protein [Acetobacterium wieringae]TYC85818.1 hypothetical protein FXB42_08075 [Acetobacterium wieringae]